MDDLIAFVKARLDEEEASALAMIAAFEGIAEWMIAENGEFDYTVTAGQLATEAVADMWREDAAVWIARHDPARVLREIAAMRAIVAAYERAPDWPGGEDVRHLAAIWNDRADYLPEWAPAV